MIAYKLCRKKEDGIYPLFINKNEPFIFGRKMEAHCYPTKGFAVREGFHCCFKPYAPHLKETLKSGEQRVWIELEVENYKTYDRPESQGGKWILAQTIMPIREITSDEVKKILEESNESHLHSF